MKRVEEISKLVDILADVFQPQRARLLAHGASSLSAFLSGEVSGARVAAKLRVPSSKVNERLQHMTHDMVVLGVHPRPETDGSK